MEGAHEPAIASAPPAEPERRAADLRVFDQNGIARAAWGWDRHEQRGLDGYHKSEKAALAFIERSDLGPSWEEYRRRLFGLTASPGALVAWKAKHGARGHKAERAAFGSALGLFARGGITADQYRELVGRWPRLCLGCFQTARRHRGSSALRTYRGVLGRSCLGRVPLAVGRVDQRNRSAKRQRPPCHLLRLAVKSDDKTLHQQMKTKQRHLDRIMEVRRHELPRFPEQRGRDERPA